MEQEPVSIEEIVILNNSIRCMNATMNYKNTRNGSYQICRKNSEKVVYQITNYQRQDTIVHATLLIYHDKVIGRYHFLS
ncbi:MAG: DUF4830 domain-containing protein [Acutalibacteraceae bacterium]